MAVRFLQTARDYFTTEFIQQLAVSLDESDKGIGAALDGFIPLNTSAVLQKLKSGKEDAQQTFDLAKHAADKFPPPQDLANLTNEEGERMLIKILGRDEHGVEHAVAKYAGIKNLSAEKLNLLVIPILMGEIGTYARENNWDADGLKQELSSEKDSLLSAVPDGLRPVAGLYGLGDQITDSKHIEQSVTPSLPRNRSRMWVLALVLIILAIGLLIYVSRGCENKIHKRDVAYVSQHSFSAFTSADALINSTATKIKGC